MNYMNIIEKLQVFMNLITNSQLLMGTIVLISLVILLFINKQINKKKLFRVVLLINIGAFLILLFSYTDQLVNIYNEIVNKVFMNIYFPSVEVYLFILLFMFVTLIISICNFKMKKSYKTINIISFFIIFYLFLMITYIVVTNNIDIFNAESIYTNKDAVAILELSTIIYVLWIIVTLITSISNTIYEYIKVKHTVSVNSEVADSINGLRNTAYETLEISKPVDTYVMPKEELVKESNVAIIEKKGYTLDEYKLFSQMLKQIILLNGYKSKITINDLTNDYILSMFSQEDRSIYKNILNEIIN